MSIHVLGIGTMEKYKQAFVVLWLLVCLSGHLTTAATANDVQRLFTDKVKNGNPKVRPVWNQTDRVNVEITVHIVALTDVHEVKQKVEATVWIEVFWKNELLVWDPNDYGNLTHIYTPDENMWKPDLAIGNGYNELLPVGLDFVLLKSFSNGATIWFPGKKVEFLCKIDVTKFPFDTQTCFMELFNWSGSTEETGLDYRESMIEDMEIEAIYANPEWSIVERRIEKRLTGHEMLRVILVLQRKSLSLVLTVLLPVILLSFLNVFVFLLPTESGEKLSFSVTVLLSQAVFLSFISGLMPQTSDSISGLSIYISAQLVLSAVYVFLTCCILRIYHRDTSTYPLPSWLLKILCFPIDSLNDVQPMKAYDGKIMLSDSVTLAVVTQRMDTVCFWLFLLIVFIMTSVYLLNGILHQEA